MEAKINYLKSWLGTGSINIFGLPMSGKDTVGMKLAELLGAKFLSSGLVIRQVEAENHKKMTTSGKLIPTDAFYDIVLPYFYREDLSEHGLILSSVGRWFGEEDEVMRAAEESGHQIKATIILNVSEADVMTRWEAVQVMSDRGKRADDRDLSVFKTRIEEFRTKTMPVIVHYQQLGKLVRVKADMEREIVLQEVIDRLYDFAIANESLE